MQRSKLEFICEKRLLFYGGGEVYQPQGNVEGATNERSKATKIVDDLLRGSTRARESDGKLLFDRIEDAKKFLGQSKDSASKDLLSKINTAKEGIITEQEYFERGEKNKNNHDHVRAYQKPWNDLFTHLRSAEELMKTAKESNSISASSASKNVQPVEGFSDKITLKDAAVKVEKFMESSQTQSFKGFKPQEATGEVKAAYDKVVRAVADWDNGKSRNQAEYQATWNGLSNAIKDLKKTEKPLDDENNNKALQNLPKQSEKKNAAESKADPRDKLQNLSPDELKAWAEGQVNVLVKNKISENFDMENLEDTERATRLLSAYESFAVTMQLWAKKSPYFTMEEYNDRWNELRFRWFEYNREQAQLVNQNPQDAAALKKAREIIKQEPVVSRMEAIVKETQPNLRWGFISNQYIKNRIKVNDGKSHNSDDYVAAFKTEEFLKYVDGIVQQNVVGEAYIKNEQYIRKGELSGKYRNMPGSDKPFEMLEFILKNKDGIGGVDFDNLKKYIDGRTAL